MSRIKDDNYYQISGWMLNRLQLKGAELQVFAIIYGFSQDGESKFTGSINYLCDWVGVSRPTIIKALKELTDKEFIIKEAVTVNGVTFNHYKVNLPYVANFTGSKDSLLGGSKDPLHYNNTIDNNTNISSKDDILDTRHTPNPQKPKTSSGKLFSSAKPKTRKTSIQKTNDFISACQREALKKEFPKDVLDVLDDYFRMLAELNCLLPSVSISEQLAYLAKVPQSRQVPVVKNTISRGWKSLQYEAEANYSGKVPAWDTADASAFTAKTEEEKSRDWRQDVPADCVF